MKINLTTSLLIFISSLIPTAVSAQHSSAKIYYLGWEVLTRTQASEDYVRKNNLIYVEINDWAYADRLHRLIRRMPCLEKRKIETLNTRIVIDFYIGEKMKIFQGDRLGLTINGKLCRYTPEFFTEVNFLKFPK